MSGWLVLGWRSSAVLVASTTLLAACGSGPEASPVAEPVSSNQDVQQVTTVPLEPSTADDTSHDLETSSVPFVVIAEDLSVGDPYSVTIAADKTTFASLDLDDSGIDFSTHVVIAFVLAESSTLDCNFQPVSDLVYDQPHERLYPVVLMAGAATADDDLLCNADANPHRIVVSVARDDLPSSSFSVWIDRDGPPKCCLDRLVFVASGELTHTNDEFPPLNAQGSLAVGETRVMYGLSTHCGVDPIFRVIDGSQWTAQDPGLMVGIDPMPDGWDQSRASIDLILERTGIDTIIATAMDTEVSVEYTRSPQRKFCD